MAASLCSGSRLACTCSMPASRAAACAAAAWSPVSMAGTMPSARSSATACTVCGRRVSATANSARTAVASASSVTLRPSASCALAAASAAALHRPRSSISRRLPSCQTLPAICACTPRPGRAVKSCDLGQHSMARADRPRWPARPGGRSAAPGAAASGARCRLCALAKEPVPDQHRAAGGHGAGLVEATARMPRACSSHAPPLMRMPRRAAAASPLTTVTGVDITSAHGQAITSSTSACRSRPASSSPAAAARPRRPPAASAKTAGV